MENKKPAAARPLAMTVDQAVKLVPLRAPFGRPLAVTVDQAAKLVPFGKTKIYEMIASGELESRLIGGRRIITMRALEDLINGNAR